MDISEKWGLPPGFCPVRFVVSEDAKNAVRGVLGAGEPVIVSLQNAEETVALIATPGRVLSVKAQEMGVNAGASLIKSFPWPSVFDLTMRPQASGVTLVIEFPTNDGGKTAEVGIRAKLAKTKQDVFAGFDKEEGEAAYRAMLQICNWKKAHPPTE